VGVDPKRSEPALERRVGWQPSRFLTDRAEAERAFALAERLGSVNAAAELGTTWPSLCKAFGRHGLGMPTPNPEAVRQRAIAAARQRTGQPIAPPLDLFVALNPNALPARPRPPAELYQWVRRDEEYATLGANVVVELNSERRADRAHRHIGDRQGRGERRQADRATRSDRTSRSHQPDERGDGRRCPLIPPRRRALDAGGQGVTHPYQGSASRACFPKIAPATCANDAPLETVTRLLCLSSVAGVWFQA
jgi:hypothetical protein